MRRRIVRRRSGRIRKGSMFGPAKHPRYAEIVKIDTPKNARESCNILLREFRNAKTRDKKRRIKQMTVLAANRAEAIRAKENLSEKERREMREAEKIYRETAEKMVMD